MRTLRWLGAISTALLLSGCISRWSGLPSDYYEDGDLRIRVQNIRTATDEYDISAGPTNFLIFSDDPLRIKLPLERASQKEAGTLCAPKKAIVETESQQPPAVGLFMHVACR